MRVPRADRTSEPRWAGAPASAAVAEQDQQSGGLTVFKLSLLDQGGPHTRAARRRLRATHRSCLRPAPGGPPTGGATTNQGPHRAREQPKHSSPSPGINTGQGHQPHVQTPLPDDPGHTNTQGQRVHSKRQRSGHNQSPHSKGTGASTYVPHRRGGGGGSRGGSLAGRAPEAYQEPPGAAKAKRKRHPVSLGGPRRTLVRQSCPTDEGTTPLRRQPCLPQPTTSRTGRLHRVQRFVIFLDRLTPREGTLPCTRVEDG